MTLLNSSVPQVRLSLRVDAAARSDGAWVLYWMTAARRLRWNFALDRALDWARQVGRPLVVCEILTSGGRWDTERGHRFVFDGMADSAADARAAPILYYPFVERRPGEAAELWQALAGQSCLVVTDDHPLRPAADPSRWDGPAPVRLEGVDGNGLLPVRLAQVAFPTAFAFRRFLQSHLPDHLCDLPRAEPFRGLRLPRLERLPEAITAQFPSALDWAANGQLAMAPLDHRVPPAVRRGGTSGAERIVGGSAAAAKRLTDFIERVESYGDHRNSPDKDATSRLSPYLRHGHISAHEIFTRLAEREGWSPPHLAGNSTGRREGWWGLSAAAEGFLDEAVTWREVGLNFCALRPDDYDRYDALPDWALKTLARHAADPREDVYSLEQFAAAATHDPLWNAAQRQLRDEGVIHNYLRMLWGKKILQWTASPREALEVMIELNNRFALDGCDPNSYSGIFWVLGRYDRAWGPERPVFGTVRYMSSENTARKVAVREYLKKFGPAT